MFHNHSKGITDMTQLATSVVLDAAADAIQMAGWSVGAESWDNRDGGGLCIEGAIGAVLGEDYYFSPKDEDPYLAGRLNTSALRRCPAYRAVREYLDLPKDRDLWYFNDSIAETGEDVIAVLRAAAAVERVKETAAVQVAA